LSGQIHKQAKPKCISIYKVQAIIYLLVYLPEPYQLRLFI